MEIFNVVMETMFYVLALVTFAALLILGLVIFVMVVASRCSRRNK